MRLTADRANSITFTATFDSPQRTTVSSPDGATIALDGISGSHGGRRPARSGSSPWPTPASTGRHGQQLRRHAAGVRRHQRDRADLDRLQLRQLPQRQRRLPGHRPQPPQRRPQRRPTTSCAARHVADYQALFGRVTIDLGRTAAADQTDRRPDRPARAA